MIYFANCKSQWSRLNSRVHITPYAYPSAVKSPPAHCLSSVLLWCRSVHVLVPKWPHTNAKMSWCRSNCPDTSSLVSKCLGSWYRSVLGPKCPVTQGQPPTIYSECSRFHLNRSIFGGVVSERVNTVRVHSKMNPIFGWSLASSRIITFNIINYGNATLLVTGVDKINIDLIIQCNVND